MPLGNLTSQLFVNIYMNEFDQFVKHKLKANIILDMPMILLFFPKIKIGWIEQIPQIQKFLREKLNLELHSNKIFIKTLLRALIFWAGCIFPTIGFCEQPRKDE